METINIVQIIGIIIIFSGIFYAFSRDKIKTKTKKINKFINLDKTTINDVTISKHYNSSMHKFSVPVGIRQKHAMKLQKEIGYHPNGYGFYSFDATLSGTTWYCNNSCD